MLAFLQSKADTFYVLPLRRRRLKLVLTVFHSIRFRSQVNVEWDPWENKRDLYGQGTCLYQPCYLSLLAHQSVPKKHNKEKKPTNLSAPRVFLKPTCWPCLIKSCYFDYRVNKPLCDLCFVLCSLDLNILHAQRVIGFHWVLLRIQFSSDPTDTGFISSVWF